jgi:predicted DNA binding CopG/RHH family protein
LERDTGERGNKFMKKKIKYTDEKIGRVEIVKDFLPSPDELVYNEDNVKVTLNLSKSSVEFFKKIARENGSQYQKIIRNLLDSYSSHYSNRNR